MTAPLPASPSLAEDRAVTNPDGTGRPAVPARAAWVLVACSFAMLLTGLALAALRDPSAIPERAVFVGLFVFAPVGALIRGRSPGNRVGTLLLSVGVTAGVATFGDAYAVYEPALPGRSWLALLTQAAYSITFGTVLLTLQLFPDGRPPSRLWRAVTWLTAVIFGALVVTVTFSPGPIEDFPHLTNPIGLEPFSADPVHGGGWLWQGLPLAGLLTIAAVVARYRRSHGEERQQMKWVAYAGVILAISFFIVTRTWGDAGINPAAQVLLTLSVAAMPVALGFAILRYRLYDIDLVISKTLVFGALAAFVTAVYVAIVVGVGSAVGAHGSADLVLSVAATATIALAFQPVRAWMQRLANRLVYGERATPYEVLAHLSEQIAHAPDPADLLARMLETLGRATGASSAALERATPEGPAVLASWSAGQPASGATHRFPIRHEGEDLAELTLAKPAEDPLGEAQEQLAREWASQAGLVLRNARLTADLLAHVEQVRTSRQRLLRAQDDERRRIERDVNAGAQRLLTEIEQRLRTLADSIEPEPARALVTEIASDTEHAIETLTDLVRGIYPPVLEAEGLPAAISAQAARHTAEVQVRAENVERYDRDVEAAVYFTILEALQNVAKYAGARTVTVTLSGGMERLSFTVSDDGAGFDLATVTAGSGTQNMADRLATVGGTLHITSAPGQGTTVRGSVPARAREPEPVP